MSNMLWGLFKKVVFFAAIVIGLVWTLSIFVPKVSDDKNIQPCTTGKGVGLCAGKNLEKYTSIGFVGRVNKDGATPVYSDTGKLLFTSKNNQSNNIVYKKLRLEDGSVDLYAYTMRDIKQGEELSKPEMV